MIYIGMEVSRKSFVIHAIDGLKKVVFKGEILPKKQSLLKDLGDEPRYVAFEAGNQMKWIAQTMMKVVGVTLHVIHPNELKWISQPSGKTDKMDARKMTELARGDLFPRKVFVVEGNIRELREMLSGRQVLLSKWIALLNGIWTIMLQVGIKLPEKFFDRIDWHDRLKKASIGETTKTIIAVYMVVIEGLSSAEDGLTAKDHSNS